MIDPILSSGKNLTVQALPWQRIVATNEGEYDALPYAMTKKSTLALFKEAGAGANSNAFVAICLFKNEFAGCLVVCLSMS